MINKILEIEIKILLLKHGYKSIITALSKIKDTSIESVISDIEKQEERNLLNKNKKAIKTDYIDLVYSKIQAHENKEYLLSLLTQFQNKTFLPELKDVRKFIEQSGGNPVKAKSRMDSVKILFETLMKMNGAKIIEINNQQKNYKSNVFSELSNEIIEKSNPNK